MAENPIADPLVENAIVDDIAKVVKVEATPEGVVFVTIDRAAHRNALDVMTIEGLSEAFETLQGAEGVRVVFIRGAGGNLCAGMDPEYLRTALNDWTEDDIRSGAMAVAKMLKALADIPSATVAVVEGRTAGAGAALAAACDMAIAVEGCEIAFAEVKLGLIPAVVAPYVVAAVGPRAAKGLFISGRAIDAPEALRLGLADEVVADAAGLDHAMDRTVDWIMTSAPGAVAEAKRLVSDCRGRPIDHEQMQDQARRLAKYAVSDEGREGITAYLERRKPSWVRVED
jgi:methylglutaconyl-CoA hydratase